MEDQAVLIICWLAKDGRDRQLITYRGARGRLETRSSIAFLGCKIEMHAGRQAGREDRSIEQTRQLVAHAPYVNTHIRSTPPARWPDRSRVVLLTARSVHHTRVTPRSCARPRPGPCHALIRWALERRTCHGKYVYRALLLRRSSTPEREKGDRTIMYRPRTRPFGPDVQ